MNNGTSERVTLNTLFGRALMHEDLCQALLHKQTRPHVLTAYELSSQSYQFFLSLDDMPDLAVLAAHVHDHFFCNGDEHAISCG